MADVYLGIGSNMGDRQANIEKALLLLKDNPELEVREMSPLVESEPEGGPPQGKYLNGCLHLRTELTPLDLLSHLKAVERRLGRQKGEPNGPRPMDLDILFYGDVVIVDGKTLSIPHPRLEKRRFVLEPLVRIAPDFIHPRLRKTVRTLFEESAHEDHPANPGA